MVTGDVDSVCLASQLRKKFGCASIVSVEDVQSGAAEQTESKETAPTETAPACYCIQGPKLYFTTGMLIVILLL